MADELREPEWECLREIGEEMDRLLQSGGWNKTQFFRLFRRALAASGGYPNCAEFVANRSQDHWLEEFAASESPKEPAA